MDMRFACHADNAGCPAPFILATSDKWNHIMGGNRNEQGESRHHWLRRYCNR